MSASRNDGSDNSCQKPASAARPSTRSRQARARVLATSPPTVARRPRRLAGVTAALLTAVAIDATLRRNPPAPATLRHMADTHEVTNQAPPLVDYDVFTADAALVE